MFKNLRELEKPIFTGGGNISKYMSLQKNEYVIKSCILSRFKIKIKTKIYASDINFEAILTQIKFL